MKRSGDTPIPFRDWLMVAGQLGWTPSVFWAAPYADFIGAVQGHNKAMRGRTGMPEPMSREEANEIFAAEERRVARLRANGR